MSALPTTNYALPTPSGSDEANKRRSDEGWLSLDEAARRMNRSRGHVARLCLKEWAKAGLAKKSEIRDQRSEIRDQKSAHFDLTSDLCPLTSGPTSGPTSGSWLVHESADPALASVKFPEQLDRQFDLRSLTEDHRQRILSKRQVLDGWEKALANAAGLSMTAAQATDQFLQLLAAQGRQVNRATLYRWRASYRASGLAGLSDDRRTPSPGTPGEGRGEGRGGSDPFLSYVQHLYLSNKAKLAVCHQCAMVKAEEQGWELRSYKACQRHIRRLPRQLIVLRRQGRKAFEDQCEPAITRTYDQLASNAIWCADHHRFDVMVAVTVNATGEVKHVRPWLTAWQDLRSRMIVGWVIRVEDPNADVILQAFQQGAAEFGLPGQTMVDNGKDFDSKILQGITKRQRREAGCQKSEVRSQKGPQSLTSDLRPLTSTLTSDLCSLTSSSYDSRLAGAFNILSIPVRHVWPYHGQSKPIERFFGTVCDRFSRLFDTYCGKDTLSKPEDLQKNIEAGKAPSLAEFIAGFGDWLSADYHQREHAGDGVNGTPAACFTANLASKTAINPDMLRFACMPRFSGPKGEGIKINKQGIAWKGLGFGAFDPSVQALYGQRVTIAIDNSDLSGVQVLTMDGRLIGRARANLTLAPNAASEDVRSAIQEKKKLRKTMKTYVEQRPRMADDMHQLVQRAAIQRATQRRSDEATKQDPPPSIKPARTAFDSQFDAISNAMRTQARGTIAVGAESFDLNASLDALRPRRVEREESETDPIDIFSTLSRALVGTAAGEDQS